ncbi:adenylate cyclase type 10-like, partial [Struthio camelus]|uniref:adenylate cyclase type 10-like n=1 Tax=Struthio camelus TaxID=8801 RepID=UPI003603F957
EVAAYVPDLLLSEDLKQENRCVQNFHGVLLFADVSGFTALTEKFSQSISRERGADEVTQTLNRYMGDILEELLAFGGDILKFAGDAVLVLWRAKHTQLRDTISLVLQCSQQIQEKYRIRETDVGLKLRLKIGISAGHMSLLTVGDKKQQHFLILGQAVGEVWQAQNLANASDVILSPSCWELCNQNKIKTKRLKGQSAVKKYVPASVLRKIDDRQPPDYLSELRPVTCLFVKLQFAADVNLTQICKAIQDSSVMMLEIIRPHKGEINKISMFDKGCTFLCVFGLPGEKLPDESVHALESALKISKACSSRPRKIEAVSVGVTSGTVFCGVVGHRVRHEYTVIGQKVNLAARLMEHYPGLVSCDAATYAASRLPRWCFKELPEAKMKGVVDPGPVYQYLGVSAKSVFGMDVMKERSGYSPLLGREEEIALFESYLKAYVDKKASHIMAFEGVTGSGKSHLLTELASLYSAMRMVLAVAMGLQACKSCSARQLVLQEKLQGLVEESSYCLLNVPFVVKFPLSEKVSKMSDAQRTMELELVFKKVLQKLVEDELVLFVIDNAYYIDSASWAVMSRALRDVPLFVVMGFAPARSRRQRLCEAAADIMKLQQTTHVHLGELKASAVVQKACRELGVVSVPRDLETFLMQRSCGIPYYCEELLSDLKRHDMLLFHLLRKGEKTEDKWESLFTSVTEASPAAASWSSSAGKDRRVCTIRPDVNLQSIVLPSTLKGIALAEVDSMKPSERMVLKCAAVIGPTFTTELLLRLLPRWTRTKMNKALNVLVRGNVLKWLNAGKVPEGSSVPAEGSATSLEEESGAQKRCLGETEKTARLQSGVAQEAESWDDRASERYSSSWEAWLLRQEELKRDELRAAPVEDVHRALLVLR